MFEKQLLKYQELITASATLYKINPNWVCALIEKESSWNTYAVRYEPNYTDINAPASFAKNAPCTVATEITCQRMSWGLGQLMGSVARKQGLDGMISELLNPAINILHMCMLINSLQKIDSSSQAVFAMYNGGPKFRYISFGKFRNQDYVDSVTSNLQRYSL